MEDLIEIGTMPRACADFLRKSVHDRKHILISGGTGTGKTTLLNILAGLIPNGERLVVIEDTAEIQLHKDNLVRLEARREQDGVPAVTIRDLLKATLRHRPDRIILGEIRGGEAFDLLQLLNTGHSGTLSTVHATSAAQGLARFHKLRSSERHRAALPRHQDQHCRFIESGHPARTPARVPVCL